MAALGCNVGHDAFPRCLRSACGVPEFSHQNSLALVIVRTAS
jgi:hypothetical protein